MSLPTDDAMKAMADKLGDLNALSLEDLGPSDDGPALEPQFENSFADANLEAVEHEGLRSGDADAAPGGHGDLPEAAVGPPGLDLALVEGGAVVVSARDMARTQKNAPNAELPSLERRGATGISAPSSAGPTPAGHLARPRGIFAWDPLSNWLAAGALGLLVAALPAYLAAASAASGDEVQSKFEAMKQMRSELSVLADPGRVADGPQDPEAVAAALSAKSGEIDAAAAVVDDELASADTRFWGIWFGLGVPLIAALGLLKRKG